MKKGLLILGMIFLVGSTEAQSIATGFTGATLQATGLTCAMCSKAINNALLKVPFVETVKSDIKNSSFQMKFKAGEEVNIDALKNAVEDAGFSVGSLKITGIFSEIRIEKDSHVKIGNENFHFLNGDHEVLKGEQTITVVDRNFVSEKQFRKYSASSKMNCVQTGKGGACCAKEGISANERVYHVII
jgi:copper chaperone CopZ